MSAVQAGSRSRAQVDALVVVIGVVIGLVVGVVMTAVAIGWALFHTAQTGIGQSVPLLITTHVAGQQITADSGNGLIVPTLVAALAGGAIAAVVRLVQRRP